PPRAVAGCGPAAVRDGVRVPPAQSAEDAARNVSAARTAQLPSLRQHRAWPAPAGLRRTVAAAPAASRSVALRSPRRTAAVEPFHAARRGDGEGAGAPCARSRLPGARGSASRHLAERLRAPAIRGHAGVAL